MVNPRRAVLVHYGIVVNHRVGCGWVLTAWWVAHWGPPTSLEGLYQEGGRAVRVALLQVDPVFFESALVSTP